MNRKGGTFRLVKFDEGGVRGEPDNLRLVCVTDTGLKLAIWGKNDVQTNVDKVWSAGLPCTVACEYREPDDWAAQKFNHAYWVREDFALVVLSR
jgi:hypothetical protein